LKFGPESTDRYRKMFELMLWIFPMTRYDAMRVKNIRDEKTERRKYDIGP
jgi:hypothetical protein